MNRTLFKATTKSNWLIGLIILLVMLMYITVIVSMFDPESMESLIAMLATLPKELVAAMGFDTIGTTLTTYLASYYYGFIAIMFPMIYSIIVANRLVAKHVDSGSMAYLLSTLNTRITIVSTQAVYLLTSITVLLWLVTTVGVFFSEAMFPGLLDIPGFLLINATTLLTFYVVSGICFFFSCIFDDAKYSVAFGAGVPIGFFVLNMLGNVSDKYAWIGNLSLFSLMDTTKILEGGSFIAFSWSILIFFAVVLYVSAIMIFNRRNLPL